MEAKPYKFFTPVLTGDTSLPLNFCYRDNGTKMQQEKILTQTEIPSHRGFISSQYNNSN